MNCSKQTRKGFTLIELLIVIAILAIIAGAVLTVLDPARRRASAGQAGAKSLARQACTNIAACEVEARPGVVCLDDLNAPTMPSGNKISRSPLSATAVTYTYTDAKYGCAFTCNPSMDTSTLVTQVGSGSVGCVIE